MNTRTILLATWQKLSQTWNEQEGTALAWSWIGCPTKQCGSYFLDGPMERTSRRRHHNPFFADDATSLQQGMEENHREHPKKILDVQRTVADAELVAVHSRIRMSADDNGMALVHLLRFQNGQIVEMWSVGQKVPEDSPNENGMF